MDKRQLIESRDPDGLQRKFKSGPAHIFNPVPSNEAESLAHGNALAASGNYPVGTDECFNVGISGGCGVGCFVYQKGECGEPGEMVAELETADERANHKAMYD